VSGPADGYARRDRFAVWLANLALRLASKRYRMMVRGSIIYGLKAAAGEPLPPLPDSAYPPGATPLDQPPATEGTTDAT